MVQYQYDVLELRNENYCKSHSYLAGKLGPRGAFHRCHTTPESIQQRYAELIAAATLKKAQKAAKSKRRTGDAKVQDEEIISQE